MSVEAIFWAFTQPIKTPAAKLILLTLANYANENHQAYPSQAKLSQLTSISERSIREHLASLEQNGYISRQHRIMNGMYFSDMFTLNLPAAKSADGEKVQLPAAKSAANTKRDKPKEKVIETLCPEEILFTNRHYEIAKQKGINIHDAFESMHDHSHGSNWKKANWPLTFNNWLKNTKVQPKNWRDDLKHTADLLTGRADNVATFLD